MGNDIVDVERHYLFISQVLVGAISPNFRMVHYELEDKHLTVWIYLEHEDDEDFEEIEEFEFYLSLLVDDDVSIEVKATVTDETLCQPQGTVKGWVVFKRRESSVE